MGAATKAIRTAFADLPGNQIHSKNAIIPYGIAPTTAARRTKSKTVSQGSDGFVGSNGRDNAINALNANGASRQERKKVRGFNRATNVDWSS